VKKRKRIQVSSSKNDFDGGNNDTNIGQTASVLFFSLFFFEAVKPFELNEFTIFSFLKKR